MLFYFFLLAGFVGVILGKDSKCLRKEIPACLVQLDLTKPIEDEKQCEKLQEIVDCLDSVSNKCNDEGQDAVRKLEEQAREICNESSPMHEDLQEFNACIKQPLFKLRFNRNCVENYARDFINLARSNMGSNQEYTDRLMNIICPMREKFTRCQYNGIKSECGEDLAEFFRKFQGPYDEVFKEACDSAKIPSISGALIFLQMLVAIFSIRKIV